MTTHMKTNILLVDESREFAAPVASADGGSARKAPWPERPGPISAANQPDRFYLGEAPRP